MAQPIYLRVSDELKLAIEKRAKERNSSVNEFAKQVLADAVGFETDHPVLDVEVTLEFLIGRAVAGRTANYDDVAEANGHAWSHAMWTMMPNHLERVWNTCRERNLPALTALVVSKTGESPGAGFVKLAKQMGYVVEDDARFVEQMQKQCFDWGARIKQGALAEPQDRWAHLRGSWRGPDTDDIQTYMRGPPDETVPRDK